MSTAWTPPGPTLLFCPADRPDRFAKAMDRSDLVVLDLEDGVLRGDREQARAAVRTSGLDPSRTMVRVNPLGTPDAERDLAMLQGTAFRSVMLPKIESVAGLGAFTGWTLMVLLETARGVLNAPAIAADEHVHAVMWGAEDLTVSVGGTSSRDVDGRYLPLPALARAAVLLAAGAAGKPAVDAVHLDIADHEGLERESVEAARSGFAMKACIHPSQIPVVRRSFRPEPQVVEGARAVLEASRGQAGVFLHEGRMVDEPLLAQARAVLLAAAPEATGPQGEPA